MLIPLRLTPSLYQEACQSPKIHMQVALSRHRNERYLVPLFRGRETSPGFPQTSPQISVAHAESYAHAQANQLGRRSETKVIGLELSVFSPEIREGFSFLKRA